MTTYNVDSEFDTLKEDLTKLRADVSNLSAALKDATSDTVRDQIELMRGRLDRITGEAKIQGQEKLDDLTSKIEARPLTSVLVAFGVGLLIGRIFDR